jgi:hypothetical protein
VVARREAPVDGDQAAVLRGSFPRDHQGRGTQPEDALPGNIFRRRRRNERSERSGIKSIDVAFNIEGLFLGLGVSIKTVGLPEGDRGYGHNFKRVSEEWTTETVLYHRYMPVSIIVGMLFLPADAASDRPRASSLNHAVEKFRGFQGRVSIRDDAELLEKIYVGLYEGDGGVVFVDVTHHLKPLEIPGDVRRKSRMIWCDFSASATRKLRVKGMPEVDDSGAIIEASPALDEALSDD